MNVELVYNILDIFATMQDAVKQMESAYSDGRTEMFNMLGTDLQDGLNAVKRIAEQNVAVGSTIRLADQCVCALESLKDIRKLATENPEKVSWKLEYELGSVLEIGAQQLYYWGIVDGHPEEKEKFEKFLADSDMFRVLKIPVQERAYACDLSIVVTGYNHLDVTKLCVASILDNLPEGIICELVLFNHGSSDGTKEYFESIQGAKTISVAVNGVVPGIVLKACRGKYLLHISNDVVIGKHAIDNLYRCAATHPDYGFIVPSTPNVSNLQTVPVNYDTVEQFVAFAEKNNVYDEQRHEQRVRLCNPLHIAPADVSLQGNLELYQDMFFNKNIMVSFPDDKFSLWMRRNGYKNILTKDAYCHHFGSVTLKHDLGKEEEQTQFYMAGRKAFYDKFHVDPWGTGFCFDPDLFSQWKIDRKDNACVLGINCGLGSNSLKVKEILREKGAHDVILYNCVQDQRYLQDLRGVSDKAFLFENLQDLVRLTGRSHYNYIVIEDPVSKITPDSLMQELEKAGLEFNELAYKMPDGTWKIDIEQKK